MSEIMKVLLCPPGKKPQLIEISNEIPKIEELLEGSLGVKVLGDGLCLLFDDDGHKKDLVINRLIQGDPIFGYCIFCRKDGEQFTSLTDEEIQDLENLLA
ncbi:MAG: DUF3846 domain-containing protein [Peptococcaceae bacterium]|nr:DUF3846 domain-containing protein [Peptococcaceae bacterium]